MKTKQDLLNQMRTLGACEPATAWVASCAESTAQAIWYACESPTWMLWYATQCAVERKTLVRLGAAFARSVLFLVPEGEQRPRVCVETLEAWCEGRTSTEEVRLARRDAYAAYSAYSAVYTAVDAAAAAAADAIYAAAAAADAAAAAAAAAVDAAVHQDARQQLQLAQCELIRKAIPQCPFMGA